MKKKSKTVSDLTELIASRIGELEKAEIELSKQLKRPGILDRERTIYRRRLTLVEQGLKENRDLLSELS